MGRPVKLGRSCLENHQLFNIPPNHVGVAFVDKAKGAVTLNDEQQLQRFYESLDQSSEETKFVV
jgi:hypothetical protein